MAAQLAEIQWPAGSRRPARVSHSVAPPSNRPGPAAGVRLEPDSRDRPAIEVLVGETPSIVAREAAILVRIVAEAEGEREREAETVSGTAAFPVAEDPAAPVDSAAAPEGTAAVTHGAAVPAAHRAWEAPVEEAAGGGGES